MRFSRKWWGMKPRALTTIDTDLKVMRGVLLDTVQDSKEREDVVRRINKLLDERLDRRVVEDTGE